MALIIMLLLCLLPGYSANNADGSGEVLADESTGNYQIEFEIGSAQLDYAPDVLDGEETIAVARTDTLSSSSNGSDFMSATSRHFWLTTNRRSNVTRSRDEPADDKITAVETHETLAISQKMDEIAAVGNETLFTADGIHLSTSMALSANYSDQMQQLPDSELHAEGGSRQRKTTGIGRPQPKRGRLDTNNTSLGRLLYVTTANLTNKPVQQPHTTSDTIYRSGRPMTMEDYAGNERNRPTRADKQITQSEERPVWTPTVETFGNPILDFLDYAKKINSTSAMVQNGIELTTESVTRTASSPRSLQDSLALPNASISVPFGIDIRILKSSGAQTMRMEITDASTSSTASSSSDSIGTLSRKAMTSERPVSTIYPLLLSQTPNAKDLDYTDTDAAEEAEGREHEIELSRGHTIMQEHEQEQQQQHTFPITVTIEYGEKETGRDDAGESTTSALVENSDFHSTNSKMLHSNRLQSRTTPSILPASTALRLQDFGESSETVNIKEVYLYSEKYSKTDFHSLLLTPKVNNETLNYIVKAVTPIQKQKLGKNITRTDREKHQNTYSTAETTQGTLGMTRYSSDEAQNYSISNFLKIKETYSADSTTVNVGQNPMEDRISDGGTELGGTATDFYQRSGGVTPELKSRNRSRTMTSNLDGHMVKVALTLKLHTDGLTEIGAAQDSQMIRKLRFSLEHQLNKVFVECPGFVRSEILSIRAGSILAEGNLLFDASFLLSDSDGVKQIFDYVTKYALPQMPSSIHVGHIDPGWAKTLRQQLLVLEAQLAISPCDCLEHICGLCFHCRNNDTAIWCQTDCDLEAHQMCVADDFHFRRSTDSRCACIESYVSVGGRCLDYRVILGPLVAIVGVSLVIALALVSLLLSRRRTRNQSSPITTCNLSRNRVDRLLSTRASIWCNPGKNGAVRKKKGRRIRCHDDIVVPMYGGVLPASSAAVTMATDKQATESSGTFVTFGKPHENGDVNGELKNDDVMRTRSNNGVTTQAKTDEVIPKILRTKQSNESVLKDELLISLLRQNVRRGGRGGTRGGRRGGGKAEGGGGGESSTNDEGSPSSQRHSPAAKTSAHQSTSDKRQQSGFNYASFYI